MRALLIGFVLLLAWPSQSVMAASADDFQYGNTGSQHGDLPYRYFEPTGYNASQSYPLILFLHGAGERGNDNEKQLRNNANGAIYLLDDTNLAEQKVFMLAPQCPSGGDWSGNTLRAALSAVDQIAAQYNIDPNRIYVTGLSMGGFGTWRAVKERPGFFAAAVPMSGGGGSSGVSSVAHVPFWYFHAKNDGTVGVGGSDNQVAALRNAGARVIYTRYDSGGHGIWSHAYRTPMLFHWLLSQRRKQRNESAPPSVHITDPVSDFSLFTDASSIVLVGTADNGTDSIDSIDWDIRDGATGTAGGTATWSTAALALDPGAHLIRVIATGPSYYSPYGGKTTFNDSIRVTRAAGVIFADGFEPF